MTPRIPDAGPGAFLILMLRRWFPVRDAARYTDAYWQDVKKECGLHIALGQLLFPIGLIAGIFLFPTIKGGFTAWDLGVGFGAGVALAFGYQLLVCAVKGFASAFEKMADYSTMMYGIPWHAQFRGFYVPCLFVGIVCAIGRVLTT
jgi:hypothetical protein